MKEKARAIRHMYTISLQQSCKSSDVSSRKSESPTKDKELVALSRPPFKTSPSSKGMHLVMNCRLKDKQTNINLHQRERDSQNNSKFTSTYINQGTRERGLNATKVKTNKFYYYYSSLSLSLNDETTNGGSNNTT